MKMPNVYHKSASFFEIGEVVLKLGLESKNKVLS